mgnify:FL=1|jgi:hypothetical protein
MESFTNNPTEWSITGNLIGTLLGELTDLSGFTGNHSTVSAGTTREIDGKNIAFMKVDYQA